MFGVLDALTGPVSLFWRAVRMVDLTHLGLIVEGRE
jgi:hypothetical protein